MKLGGLFSGVGGLELAWTQLGHEVAWMCEIDKNARKVLNERFPSVPVYEDVEQLDPAEVEAVDVLTGGSPCQGFSVAGTRSGLEHGESRLFADYIRIMDGLAQRGLRYAVWENVPGVISIENDNGERTFEHVVAALAGGTVPVRLPSEQRWNTGLASGRDRAVAWRVLDSRYFGVAQRRRRIFACVAFGDSAEDRAGRAILAVAEGVRRDPEARDETGQDAARRADGRPEVPSLAGALGITHGGDDLDRMTFLPDTPEETGQGADLTASESDQSLTLSTGNGQTLFQPYAFRKSKRAQSKTDDESWVSDGNANTLNVFDVGETRATHVVVEPPAYGVRRLTPVECERLQSFPDGWTEPAGSDSARYKAMGNAVTVNVVRWILGRLP